MWWAGGRTTISVRLGYLGYTMLTLHGAEMRDKWADALLLVYWIVDTAIAEYGRGRTNLRNQLDDLASLKAKRP